jgi:hypothetical protein
VQAASLLGALADFLMEVGGAVTYFVCLHLLLSLPWQGTASLEPLPLLTPACVDVLA